MAEQNVSVIRLLVPILSIYLYFENRVHCKILGCAFCHAGRHEPKNLYELAFTAADQLHLLFGETSTSITQETALPLPTTVDLPDCLVHSVDEVVAVVELGRVCDSPY